MEQEVQTVGVAQASAMLGIGKQAVRERIKVGTLNGSKESVGGREEWRIPLRSVFEAQGLPRWLAQYLCVFFTPLLMKSFQTLLEETGSRLADDAVRELREGLEGIGTDPDLRERLGYERGRREAAEKRVEELARDVNALVEELGRASARGQTVHGTGTADDPSPHRRSPT